MAILEVSGLVKYFKGRKVVDGVNFQVHLGEIVGLLGPNGAGKTTSFRMATGQIPPNDGKVVFDSQDVTALPMFKRARLGMGYLAQETSVFRKLNVEQNILAVLEAMPRHRSLGRKLTRRERFDMTDKVLEQFGLSHLRKNSAARLSGGEKRRLEIARCLVCDPLLILLDEPFTGIDPPTIADIKGIIKSLKDQNIGILITDHQAREILTVADRVYLIHKGQVFVEGSPAEVSRNRDAIKTYLGDTVIGLDFGDGAYTAQHPGQVQAARPPLRSHVIEAEIALQLERLRGPEYQEAARTLLSIGAGAVPGLVSALNWPDVEWRRRAWEVLQRLLPGLTFDPFATEVQRRQQVAAIRSRLTRLAG